jgi:hypothetical protein
VSTPIYKSQPFVWSRLPWWARGVSTKSHFLAFLDFHTVGIVDNTTKSANTPQLDYTFATLCPQHFFSHFHYTFPRPLLVKNAPHLLHFDQQHFFSHFHYTFPRPCFTNQKFGYTLTTKTTAPRIPMWSPTMVLTRRHFA